jgi:hypothetical protein
LRHHKSVEAAKERKKKDLGHPSIAVVMVHHESMGRRFLLFLIQGEAIGSSCVTNCGVKRT